MAHRLGGGLRCIGSHFLLPIISITEPRWPAVASVRSSAFQPRSSSSPRPIRTGTTSSAPGTQYGNSGNKLRCVLPRRNVHAARIPDTAEFDRHMDGELAALIKHIHALPTKTVIYATGGGVQALSWLLTVPGSSRTILDARIPYAQAALAQVLGGPPAKFASPESATTLAAEAYRSAALLAPFGTAIVGLGCTAALVTDRAKAGDHKIQVAAHTSAQQTLYQLRLSKGARDRIAEDAVASRLIIRALAETDRAFGGAGLDLGLGEVGEGGTGPTEELKVEVTEMGDHLEDMWNGKIRTVEFSGGQVVRDAPRAGRIYLPGSYNPLHEGHIKLLAAAVAKGQHGAEGCFELSIGNADKGQLPLAEVRRRVDQFVAAGLPVVVTQAPLFTTKSELLPESTFVVGYDTAVRLVNSKYYGGDVGMAVQFTQLRMRGCSFLVAGRREVCGDFKTLDDIVVPEALEGLFTAIDEDDFRADISSSELRQQQAAESTDST